MSSDNSSSNSATGGSTQPATSAAPATPATPSSSPSPSGAQPQRSGPWLAPPTKPQPLDLSVDRGESFRVWRRRWDSFFRLSNLGQADQQMQHDIFISCVSDDTMKVIDNFPIASSSRLDVKEILKHLETYARGQVNETVEHHNLAKRTQQPGERFDEYLTCIRDLTKTCSFCDDCTELIVRDKIVTGVIDVELRRKLLQFSSESALTLDKAIQISRADEATNIHEQEFAKDDSRNPYANRVQKDRSSTSRTRTSGTHVGKHGKPDKPSTGTGPCKYCGGSAHRDRNQCPASERTCSKCRKKGHFASVCLSSQRSTSSSSSHSGQPGRRHQHSNVARVIASTQACRAPTVTVDFSTPNGTCTIAALPDTGADISAAGPDFLQSLGENVSNLLPPTDQPKSADGSPMKCLGQLPVTVAIGDRTASCTIHILENLSTVLLSWDTTRDLALIHQAYPAQISSSDINNVANTPDEHVTADDLFREFPKVFDGVLRTMPGELFSIKLQTDATPLCVNTPRRVPFPQRDALKAQLDKLHAQGVIVPVTQPTPWCSPIVVVPKKNTDEVRLCVDFTHLNKFVQRERYQSATPSESVANIASARAKVFTTFDALKGYHQCPLDNESQLLTTFITPFGRWMYLRAPYGVSSISEHYNRRMDAAFEGMSQFAKLVNDVVVYDKTRQDHTQRVREFLQRCLERGISLNKDKFVFAQPKVTFAGYELSSSGYSIDPQLVVAIHDFPEPTNITELRSFFGLVNQLSLFTDQLAELLQPLRPLLSAQNEYVWDAAHSQAFMTAKCALASPPTLAFYDPCRPTSLRTDASRLHGLGFILMQKQEDDSWHIVQCGSRFLTETESRYAAVELELLGIVWAVLKCRLFLSGLPLFSIFTDHKPLIPILNSKQLDEIENPRLQRLRMKILEYSFTASWVKGTANAAPDALSRAPVSMPTPDDELGEDQDAASINSIIISNVQSVDINLRLDAVRSAIDSDHDAQLLLDTVRTGFPNTKDQLQLALHPYWALRDSLSIDDGLVVYGCRLVIPAPMRKDVLNMLHASHQGKERTKQRARQIVYWPGLDNDIVNITRNCQPCQRELPTQPKEPYVAHEKASRPFQQLSMDFATHAGRQVLVVVDHFSSWTWVFVFPNATSRQLIGALRDVFCMSGAPDIIWSDNGPQFSSSRFQQFCREWGVSHRTSSPHYPQSNGRAEAAIKSMKKLFRRCWNSAGAHLDQDQWTKGILQYRNTPTKQGPSPAQLLFGQPVQDMVPAHHRAFLPEYQKAANSSDTLPADIEATARYDATAHPLPSLTIGTPVAIQNDRTKLWDRSGVVVDVGPHRKYFVRLPSGRILTRNRRFLRRRYIASLPPSDTPLPDQKPPLSANPAPASVSPSPNLKSQLRRSTRVSKKPDRLIEHDDL